MEKLVKFIKKYVINTAVGDFLVNEVRIRRIDEKMYDGKMRRQYKRDAAAPTPDMLEEREYFKANRGQILKNLSYLSDDESKECYKQIIKYRCTHKKKDAPRNCSQCYFVESIIRLSNQEVFIDGGGFVGDTVKEFYRLVHGRYRKIVSFEPDSYNYKMLSKIKYKNFYAVYSALWKSSTTLKFFNNMSVGSKVVDDWERDGNDIVEIKAEKLDQLSICKDATFIKLDVEGAELAALQGMKNTIIKNKPKLAICLYHSKEDMIQLIEYVHGLVPEYSLYVRHHSKFTAETVLYATALS